MHSGETKPLHREREREACVKHREGRMEGGLSTASPEKEGVGPFRALQLERGEAPRYEI